MVSGVGRVLVIGNGVVVSPALAPTLERALGGGPTSSDVVVKVTSSPADARKAFADTAVTAAVCVSSAMVYGAWPDNPVPLTEDAAVRPNPGFAVANTFAELERIAREWRSGDDGRTLAVLRPATVLGPDEPDTVVRVLAGVVPVRVRGDSPPAQYVDRDDVVEAIRVAVAKRLDGVFNVAPPGWIAGEEVEALRGDRRRVRLPARVFRMVSALFSRNRAASIAADLVPYLLHPWVVANDRLVGAGWRPRHSNEEVLVTGLEGRAPRELGARQRQHLSLGIAVVGVSGVVAGVVALARRRRGRAR
jgi:nucleoside-diphosphate-sugar epimerase